MLEYFIMFIAGAMTMRALQKMLDVAPNFNTWKHTEYTILQILADMHVQRLTANEIIKLMYEESGKQEEYVKVKSAIEQKYNALINNSLNNLKKNLPYKVEYNNLKEAVTIYLKKNKERSDG